ncbi:PH domain-containing protein [Natrialba asiatica]|uniref:YdbS-like PH domain-containing protein n=1 Tax=Natrialba asiatica (strain ATCC 700177 / DSM 12278 / JCM 9576 / FERM P-10747 / NBRC 102637 / 172P1) TaxID=29540 RepID=M0ANZ0_NATA1|nr:PH domain-containing protein [Natrialba asiatica]ELZ00022.1 hypothetical protein C481_13539 [Natrialba asiatica DSM 12278]
MNSHDGASGNSAGKRDAAAGSPGPSDSTALGDAELAWLALAPDEPIRWRGRPRIQTIYPWLAVTLLGTLTLLAAVVRELVPWQGLLLVVLLVVPTAWQYARLSRTVFVITARRVAIRQGVLGRSVRTVSLEHIQNTTVTQGVAGRFVGYGTVSIDTAGGTLLAFWNVDDPSSVRRTLNRYRSRCRDRRLQSEAVSRSARSEPIPGTLAQWQAVREEVRAARRALDERETVR